MEFVKEIFASGGILMYPLIILLIWGLVIIIIKALTLRRKQIINPHVVGKIEQLLLDKKIPEATAFCKQHPLPMTNILLAAILHYQQSEAELKEILEEAGRQELPIIHRYLTTLGTIASVAPLMGLLGTVVGMIAVFATLSGQTSINANDLAGGISEALVTTACGLVIAMPTLAFYNHFVTKVNNLIIEMEKISLHVIAVLKRTKAS